MTSASFFGTAIEDARVFGFDDYSKNATLWCSGCGDLGVLNGVKRLLQEEQLKPERTVFVSGIGCSSRFPHYLDTYGFHGIHGRALPLATGMKLARPELDVFVVMGDGDCCSIGAGHWVHATRYNANMVVLLLDNEIYGLTKNQTSPTTPQAHPTQTQPHGSFLPALHPLSVTLGVSNVSFVAQTADWIPAHLFATLRAAYRHRGLSFIRVLQRCPKFMPALYADVSKNPWSVEVLEHDDGLRVEELSERFTTRTEHDPSNLDRARELAEVGDRVVVGLFYKDESRPVYDDVRSVSGQTAEQKLRLLNTELDRYAV